MFVERFLSYLIIAMELFSNIGRVFEMARGLLQAIRCYIDSAYAKSPE